MTDAAITALDIAEKAYLEARAAKGMPLLPADKSKPLPSFVMRVGEAAKPRDWAPIRHAIPAAKTTVQAPDAEPAVVAPKREPKLVKGAQGVGRAGTAAEQVRNMIRAAMAAGRDVNAVIMQVQDELKFGEPKARRYVTENWARIEKANKK